MASWDLLEQLDKMAAPDPLAPLELEASLESWDSPDPRVLLVKVGSLAREEQWDPLVQLVPLERTVMLVLQDPLDLLVLLVREENRDLAELPDSKVSQDPRVLLVRVASPESRVCPVKLEPQDLLEIEVTEDSPVSVVHLVLLGLLVLVDPLDLLEMRVPREILEPPVLPEPRVLLDCRECLVSVEPLAFQD